jgi:hypothetical protein
MSDITINSGDQINVSVQQTTLQNTVVIPKVTTSLSVRGVTGGGGDAHYVHNQMLPAASWAITHNLGKKPAVSVVDTTDAVVYGDINYINDNQLTISFSGAFSGKAYLN